jgi:hypothetical protein
MCGAVIAAVPHQELQELDDFDNLDPTSLWDALAAAAGAGEKPAAAAAAAVKAAPLSQRLSSLYVSGCFWNSRGLFGTLKLLTGLTQLR